MRSRLGPNVYVLSDHKQSIECNETMERLACADTGTPRGLLPAKTRTLIDSALSESSGYVHSHTGRRSADTGTVCGLEQRPKRTKSTTAGSADSGTALRMELTISSGGSNTADVARGSADIGTCRNYDLAVVLMKRLCDSWNEHKTEIMQSVNDNANVIKYKALLRYARVSDSARSILMRIGDLMADVEKELEDNVFQEGLPFIIPF